MKTKKLELSNEEAKLLNNILVEHCMSVVELLNTCKTKQDHDNTLKIIQSSVFSQQTLFAQVVSREYEFGEGFLDFLNAIIEAAIEYLKEIKEKTNDILQNVTLSTNIDLLEGIIKKIPEKSLIIT